MRRQLADAMSVIIEALRTRTDLLDIFATDVDGTVAEKNAAYAHRWEVAQSKTSAARLLLIEEIIVKHPRLASLLSVFSAAAFLLSAPCVATAAAPSPEDEA